MPERLDQLQRLLLDSKKSSLPGTDATESPALSRLFSACKKSGHERFSLEAYGTWGSLPRLIATLAAANLQRPVLYLTAHIPDAFEAQDDLETFLARPVQLFPAAEAHETDLDPKSEIASERLRICQNLFATHNSQHTTLIVAPVQALMQPVPGIQFLQQRSLTLKTDQSQNLNGPDKLAEWLTDQNYGHVDQVDLVGEFAVRGGIVDIFPPAHDLPVRVEFFGDQIESLRQFDLDTQRSVHTLDSISISSCVSTAAEPDQRAIIFDYLPSKTLLFMEETAGINEAGHIFRDRLEDPGSIYPIETVLRDAAKFDTIYLNRFLCGLCKTSVNFHARSVQRFENRSREALGELLTLAGDHRIHLFCEKPALRQRLLEMLEIRKPPENFHLPIGFVHHGFELPEHRLFVLNHHEVFGQHQPHRRIRKIQSTQAIDSFADLKTHDLVVHVNHGIGRFRGLKTLTKNGRQEEFLAIEFADKAVVHVPAGKIELIHKYVGARAARPKLSKLGGRTWERQKQKVSDAVEDMAAELIDFQARRQSSPGISFPSDTTWQKEFEQSFPYQDTKDQTTVNIDIKNDMQLSLMNRSRTGT